MREIEQPCKPLHSLKKNSWNFIFIFTRTTTAFPFFTFYMSAFSLLSYDEYHLFKSIHYLFILLFAYFLGDQSIFLIVVCFFVAIPLSFVFFLHHLISVSFHSVSFGYFSFFFLDILFINVLVFNHFPFFLSLSFSSVLSFFLFAFILLFLVHFLFFSQVFPLMTYSYNFFLNSHSI